MIKIGELMKKVIIAAMTMLVFAGAAEANKLDPYFNFIKSQKAAGTLSLAAKTAAIKSIEGEIFVGAIIKTTDTHKLKEEIELAGGSVNLVLKSVITAELPLDIVGYLSEMEEVVYIEASKRLTQKMNFARKDGITYVENVQPEYTGSGVITGTYDSGVDCSRADFQGRVKYYWDKKNSKEYTSSELTADECRNIISGSEDGAFHGTHTAGIMSGADGTYKGVAPDADIVVVQMDEGSTSEALEAMKYIFDKADTVRKPAVINISLGTSLGPHDGTSVFERGIDELLINSEGRAIVCAAGNENVNPFDDQQAGNRLGGLHASVNVSNSDVGFETIVRSTAVEEMIFDIWLDEGSDCSIEVALYNSERRRVATTGRVAAGKNGSANYGGASITVDFTETCYPGNGKQHPQVLFTFSSNPTNLTYDLIFRNKGGGCTGHAWIYPDHVAYNVFTKGKARQTSPTGDYIYADGDSDYMITVPATAESCIAVASFSARDTYTDIDSDTQSQDIYSTAPPYGTGTKAADISLFSSRGPGVGTANRQKPTISAPGEPIISALSSVAAGVSRKILGDATHVKMEGTSMASPLVAGIIALMFEKNGCLTHKEIVDHLTGTAYTDTYTGAKLPDYTWGYGKVDALAAVNAVTASSCVPNNSDRVLPELPVHCQSSGSKGCELRQRKTYEDMSIMAIVFVFVAIIAMVYRRQKN